MARARLPLSAFASERAGRAENCLVRSSDVRGENRSSGKPSIHPGARCCRLFFTLALYVSKQKTKKSKRSSPGLLGANRLCRKSQFLPTGILRFNQSEPDFYFLFFYFWETDFSQPDKMGSDPGGAGFERITNAWAFTAQTTIRLQTRLETIKRGGKTLKKGKKWSTSSRASHQTLLCDARWFPVGKASVRTRDIRTYPRRAPILSPLDLNVTLNDNTN